VSKINLDVEKLVGYVRSETGAIAKLGSAKLGCKQVVPSVSTDKSQSQAA
jgi:hypothetical protein